MPVIIDGNNLLHSLPRDLRSRGDVRRHALDAVRHEAMQVVLVFDGPPPRGTPVREHLGRVTVQYSGSVAADDVIIKTIPAGGSASQWVVVSDDRALRARAHEKGATARTLAEWRGRRTRTPRLARDSPLSSREIAQWEEYFSGGGDDEAT